MNISGFLRWWGEQLTDCLPTRVRGWLTEQGTVLHLQRDDTHWQASLRHGRAHRPLSDDATLDAPSMQAALREHPGVQRIELQLPAGQYLARHVDLPLAAADDLPQAIGYQIETLTPFKRDQLWLFCGEQQRLPDGKRLRAWLVAVPRQAAGLLQDLQLTSDTQPVRGPRQAPAPGAPITLGFPPRGNRRNLPLGWLLLGLNLLALLLAASLHVDNRQAELTQLKAQSRALQSQAVAASDLSREVDTLQKRLSSLQAQHSALPTRVSVLEELSRRLDDQTWVQRLELRQQQLRLQGSSNNASALIGALDGSPLLSEVRFEASLTRDPSGGERFNLTSKVIPAGKPPTDSPTEAKP